MGERGGTGWGGWRDGEKMQTIVTELKKKKKELNASKLKSWSSAYLDFFR